MTSGVNQINRCDHEGWAGDVLKDKNECACIVYAQVDGYRIDQKQSVFHIFKTNKNKFTKQITIG